MKAKYITIKNLMFLFIVGTMLLVACSPKENEADLIRLFRTTVTISTPTTNSVTVSWTSMNNAVSYTLYLSRDSFVTVDSTVTVAESVTNYTFKNLRFGQKYIVGITANNADATKNSKMAVSSFVTTPTLLGTPIISDISMVIKWNDIGEDITGIKVMNSDSSLLISDYTLTSTEISNRQKEVTGLSPLTSYIIILYTGTTYRASHTYTTIATPGKTVIDLRNITGNSTVLSDTLLSTSWVSGTVIILRRGETYACNNSAALTLSRSVTIMCMPGSDSHAVLTFNQEIHPSGNIDSIKFSDVTIKGGIKTADNTRVAYFINTTTSNSCLIGKLSFDSCHIMSFTNSVVRLQTGADPWGIITKLYVNNCIISDSTGAYAVFHAANGTGNKIDDIEIRNSTIYRSPKGLILDNQTNISSILLDNCTFNEMVSVTASYYFIDCGTNTVGSFSINNCILGRTTASDVVYGIRAGTATSVTTNNTYYTSDFNVTDGTIPSIIAYGNTAAKLFKDPANGDFTIIDDTFAGNGNAGDPRWYSSK